MFHFLYAHKDTLEVLGAGIGGLAWALNTTDHALKILIGVSTLIFMWYKIINERKRKQK